jgi:hypothetical protein
MMRSVVVVATLLLPLLGRPAAAMQSAPKAGDASVITRDLETSQRDAQGGTGSSTDIDRIVERVIQVSPAGLELEYDEPPDTTADDRARDWQWPARVLKSAHGPMQLLNRVDLEARLDRWLQAAKLPRTVCGHWYFSWNAFHIDCDPESALRIVEQFDLRRDDLRDGGSYQDPMALAPARLTKKTAGPNGATFVAEMALDPEKVRQGRAHSDVVIAEITKHETLPLDAALRAHAADAIHGTITATFTTDAAGDVQRRTTVTTVEVKDARGRSETTTSTETVSRQPLPDRSATRD